MLSDYDRERQLADVIRYLEQVKKKEILTFKKLKKRRGGKIFD
jgi:hypothetical protein